MLYSDDKKETRGRDQPQNQYVTPVNYPKNEGALNLNRDEVPQNLHHSSISSQSSQQQQQQTHESDIRTRPQNRATDENYESSLHQNSNEMQQTDKMRSKRSNKNEYGQNIINEKQQEAILYDQARQILRKESSLLLKSLSDSIHMEDAQVQKSNVEEYTNLLLEQFKYAREIDQAKIKSIPNLQYQPGKPPLKIEIVSELNMKNARKIALIYASRPEPDFFQFQVFILKHEIELSPASTMYQRFFKGKESSAFNDLSNLFDHNYERMFVFLIDEFARINIIK